jgi:DNA polymerase
MCAMRHKGREFTAGRVTYLFDGVNLWYALPSGRVLCYPSAHIEDGSVSYAKAAWKPAADAVEWPRARLWAGLACENITQAIANDLLRDALRRIGHTVVLHVHDEIVLEVKKEDAAVAAQDLETVMCSAPAWAEGLPLAVGVSTLERYGK